MAATPVGAAGAVTATTASDSGEFGPLPAALTATTTNRNELPASSRDTVHGLAVGAAHGPVVTWVSGRALTASQTWNEVTGAAAVEAGPVQATDIDRSPFTVATGLSGVPGVMIAVTPAEAADCAPSTPVYTADTVKKYWVPGVSPETVQGLAAAATHAPVVTRLNGPPTAVDQYTL